MAIRTFLFALLVAAVANAFVPAALPSFATSKTQLQFGFLKELGIEKPSWLPDFGGKKEEKTEAEDAPAAAATEGEGDDTPNDAPKEE